MSEAVAEDERELIVGHPDLEATALHTQVLAAMQVVPSLDVEINPVVVAGLQLVVVFLRLHTLVIVVVIELHSHLFHLRTQLLGHVVGCSEVLDVVGQREVVGIARVVLVVGGHVAGGLTVLVGHGGFVLLFKACGQRIAGLVLIVVVPVVPGVIHIRTQVHGAGGHALHLVGTGHVAGVVAQGERFSGMRCLHVVEGIGVGLSASDEDEVRQVGEISVWVLRTNDIVVVGTAPDQCFVLPGNPVGVVNAGVLGVMQ